MVQLIMIFWIFDPINIHPSDYLSLYGLSILIVSAMYTVFGGTLKHLTIKGLDKKTTYVTANIIKGIVMMIIFPTAFVCFWKRLFFYKLGRRSLLDYHIDVIVGALYASTDTVSIFLERRKSWATTLHHIGVVIGYLLLITLQPLNPICEHLLAFGNMGILTGMVNMYLGLRFLVKHECFINCLRQFVFYLYAFFWSTNLIIQISLICNNIQNEEYWALSIIPLLIIFINDDIVLMKFLYKHDTTLKKH